ncbi:Glutaredoxin [Stigmatella aurantiaca DW4/3-1]|uniref:Glutaredoxin n=2 Tax=Stigmatella aurantiaca TaxID=41 RepID=E3FQN1_STIAD|nr:glutaredoxin 3 [Stigmatella aurantiaca]ADO70724.1 Glutaredoxin [Stigmatella aurantiaca DW4/3-1]
MVPITLYTKSTCPFSRKAKQLLDEKGARYEEIAIDLDPSKRDEMIAASGGNTTVPQIFIAGRYIGGSDELQRLEDTGQLEALLERSGAQPSL